MNNFWFRLHYKKNRIFSSQKIINQMKLSIILWNFPENAWRSLNFRYMFLHCKLRGAMIIRKKKIKSLIYEMEIKLTREIKISKVLLVQFNVMLVFKYLHSAEDFFFSSHLCIWISLNSLSELNILIKKSCTFNLQLSFLPIECERYLLG